MSIELVTKYAPQTDELFKAESKISLLTNTNYDWTGAHSIKLYKISTSPMNDYARTRTSGGEDSAEALSRYGKLLDLSATTEELLLKHQALQVLRHTVKRQLFGACNGGRHQQTDPADCKTNGSVC